MSLRSQCETPSLWWRYYSWAFGWEKKFRVKAGNKRSHGLLFSWVLYKSRMILICLDYFWYCPLRKGSTLENVRVLWELEESWSLVAHKILLQQWEMVKYLLNFSFKQDHYLQSKNQTAPHWSLEWSEAFCSVPQTAPEGWSETLETMAVGAVTDWGSLQWCSLLRKWSPKAIKEQKTLG